MLWDSKRTASISLAHEVERLRLFRLLGMLLAALALTSPVRLCLTERLHRQLLEAGVSGAIREEAEPPQVGRLVIGKAELDRTGKRQSREGMSLLLPWVGIRQRLWRKISIITLSNKNGLRLASFYATISCLWAGALFRSQQARSTSSSAHHRLDCPPTQFSEMERHLA